MPLGKVDFHSRDHRYVQIARQIRAMIDNGEYQPGRVIPSEAYLIQHYGVARGTVRSAIHVLEQLGYLDVVHAKGTFVADHPPKPGTAPDP